MKAEWKILLLSLASIVAGCNVERMELRGGDEVITDYLICYYALMTDVEFSSDGIYCPSYGIKSYGKYDFLRDKTDSLRKVYDDCHFNQAQPPGLGYMAYVNEFRRIEITSDADFNDVPAGQSLAGKVAIMAFSPYIWLKSGSVLTYDWSDYNAADGNPRIDECLYCRPPIHLVYKTLDTVSPDDLKLLLDDRISFHFIEQPAIKEHNFTIRFVDDRQSYEGTVSVTFGS